MLPPNACARHCGRAATQSSTWTGGNGIAHSADRVLDGAFDTENHTARGSDHWLSIDLGQDAQISRIDVFNRFMDTDYGDTDFNDLLSGGTVEVLDDGVQVWTSDSLTSDKLNSFGFEDLEGIVGDEIRINDTSNYLHVSEVDVFGEFIDGINLTDTLGTGAATQSSTWTSGNDIVHSADRVLDGLFETENHTAKGSDHWLSIDLGQDAQITKINISNRFIDSSYGSMRFNNLLQNATVEILDDGVEVWTSESLTAEALQTFNYSDFGGAVGDEIIIRDTDSNYMHVSEVDVYGFFM